MGTNYYIVKHIRSSKLEEIKNLVTEENIYNGKLIDALNEFKKIHLGKSSVGWQFLFDHNNREYYETNKESINDFIKTELQNGGKLIDEYGEKIPIDIFWKIVDDHKDGFDLRSNYYYELERWNEYKNNPEKFKDEYSKPHKPFPDYMNFPEVFDDGLRFAFSTDFC